MEVVNRNASDAEQSLFDKVTNSDGILAMFLMTHGRACVFADMDHHLKVINWFLVLWCLTWKAHSEMMVDKPDSDKRFSIRESWRPSNLGSNGKKV